MSAFAGKWLKTVTLETSAASAISATETSSKPRSRNRRDRRRRDVTARGELLALTTPGLDVLAAMGPKRIELTSNRGLILYLT